MQRLHTVTVALELGAGLALLCAPSATTALHAAMTVWCIAALLHRREVEQAN